MICIVNCCIDNLYIRMYRLSMIAAYVVSGLDNVLLRVQDLHVMCVHVTAHISLDSTCPRIRLASQIEKHHAK